MSKVAIVTDTCACLPQELVEKYRIQVLPVYVIFDGQSHEDWHLVPSEFYERMKTLKKLPSTSSPTTADYLAAFKRAREETDAVLCITYSSSVGMAFNCASAAVEELGDRSIRVLDSTRILMAQGFVALEAARKAQQGGTLEEVEQVAHQVVQKAKGLITVDTLEYLIKGGRAPRLAGLIGSLLNIQPIITIEGEVRLVERARGRRKAVGRILELVARDVGAKGTLHIAVHHGNVPEEAESLRQEIQRRFDCAELYVTTISPVIGAHTGGGCLGMAYYVE